jgi:pSer/pThr/pTyr-binding forkhead associated (FHA) protein
MAIHLMMTEGPQAGQTFPLDKDFITLGRAPDNDIVVNHPQVSRRHARIRRQEEWLVLEDLGSTNGTFVDDQRLTGSHALQPGDAIGLGTAVTLTLRKVAREAPRQPEQPVDSDTLKMGVEQPPARSPSADAQWPQPHPPSTPPREPSAPRPAPPPSSWQPAEPPPFPGSDRPAYGAESAPPEPSVAPPRPFVEDETEDETERKTWLWVGLGCLAIAFVCFAVGLFLWFAPEGFWLALQDVGIPIPTNPF